MENKITIIRNAIAMLSSMVNSGEYHTQYSRRVKDDALEAIESLSKVNYSDQSNKYENLKFEEITFFHKGDNGISPNMYENVSEVELINLNSILSITNIKKLFKAFSGEFVGEYAIISMSNNENYYIKKGEYLTIIKKINYGKE